jgi:hypothetical protein
MVVPLWLSACASLGPKPSEVQTGEWEARALVRDARSGRSFILRLSIAAQLEDALRVDAVAPLGQPIASILWQKNKATVVLYEQRRFFEGSPSDPAVAQALQIPIDLTLWQDIVFDRPINQKGWSCTKDNAGLVQECRKIGQEVSIRWGERAGHKRTVRVESGGSQVQMNFQTFRARVGNPDKLKAIKIPNGYTRISKRQLGRQVTASR